MMLLMKASCGGMPIVSFCTQVCSVQSGLHASFVQIQQIKRYNNNMSRCFLIVMIPLALNLTL